jgi:nitric oxide dioxygenase
MYVWYEQGANSRLPVHGVFPGTMDISQVRLPDNASYHLCGPRA